MHKGTMRRVKLALLGLAGATMFSGAAMAADLSRPVYKAPPAGALPVTYDWTGFYVGGHIGYGWADKSWQDLVGFGTVSHKADGFLGGGQAGFNYQTGMFVLGVEGDVSWADIKGGSNLGPRDRRAARRDVQHATSTSPRPSPAASVSRSTAGWSTARAVSPGRTTSTTPTSTPSRARSS